MIVFGRSVFVREQLFGDETEMRTKLGIGQPSNITLVRSHRHDQDHGIFRIRF